MKTRSFRIPVLKGWAGLVFACGLCGGIALTGWTVHREQQYLRGELLDEAVFASRSFVASKIQQLTGKREDLDSAIYPRIQGQLDALRRNMPDCRFTYLMGRRPVQPGDPESITGQTIFFYADSEPDDSEDASLPGDIFFEANWDEVRVFETAEANVFSAIADQWGVWVSAYAPVVDPTTGEVIAIFGMDIDVRDWNRLLLRAAIPPVVLTVLLLGVVLGGFFLLNHRHRKAPEERSWLWRLEPVWIVMAGLLITLYAAMDASRLEAQRGRQQFRDLTHGMMEDINRPLRQLYEMKMPALARFFEASDEVDAEEFEHFTRLLTDRSFAETWGWMRLVPAGEKSAFEQAVHPVWEPGPEGRMVPAAEREVHYPLVHVEPRDLHSTALGFDLGSCPVRLAAIESVLHSGLPGATDPLVLVSEDESAIRMIFLHPVRLSRRWDQVSGMVITAVRLDQLLMPLSNGNHYHAEAFLERADGTKLPLDTRSSPLAEAHEGLTRSRPITLFGEAFHFKVALPHRAYMPHPYRGVVWITLAGTLITASLAILIGVPLQRRRKLEKLVAERTEDLARSELDFEKIAAKSRTFFWETDCNGLFTKVSGSVLEVLGYDPDSLIGKKSYCDLSAEENRESNREIARTLLEGVEPFSRFENRMVTRGGERIWTLSNAVSVRDAEGRTIGLRGSDTNITGRKRMDAERDRLFQEISDSRAILLSVVEDQKIVEDTLRRQERLLSAASDAGRILLSETEIETAVPKALAGIGEASGQDRVYVFEMHPDGPSGVPLASQRHEWVRDGITPQIGAAHLQNLPIKEACPRWHDRLSRGLSIEGAVKDFPEKERLELEAQDIVSVLAVPLEVDGQFWGFIGLDNCREVVSWSDAERATLSTVAASIGTAIARRRAERDLRESESRFQHLLERIDHIPVQGYDEQHRVIYWNSASEEVYGYTRVEAMGRRIEDLTIPDTMRDKVRQGIDRWLSGGAPISAGEVVLRDKQGGEVPVYSSHILHETESGEKEIFSVDIDLRLLKTVEEALQQSSARNRALLDANPDMMFLFDADGKIVDYHAPDKSLLLLPPEEFLNRPIRETLPPELAEGALQRMEQIRRTGRVQEYIYSLTLLGDERFFESRMVPCGEFFMNIVRDVTQDRRMQQAVEQRIIALTRPLSEPETLTIETLFDLEEIQRIQDEFAEATGVAALITLPDGTPVTRPSRFTRLCGELIWKTEKGYANCCKSEAAMGSPTADGPVVHPCLSCGLWDAGVAMVVGGRHIGNWLIGQVRDGTQDVGGIRDYAREIGADEEAMLAAFAEVPVMPEEQFRRVAQALYTLVKQLTDSAYMNMQQARFIAEEKEHTRELIQLSTAIEQSPETVVITDAAGTIEYVNPAFERITGYSAAEAIGENPRVLKSGQHDKEFYTKLWKTISSGEVWSGRLINRRKNGEIYTEEASIAPVRDESRAITHYVAIKRDITAELAQEELLQQSQKMEAVGQLAGGVAHDFNNILQAVLGFSEILINRLPKGTGEQRNAEEIKKAALRAADLVRKLLAFSRKHKAERKPIELNQMVKDTEVLLHVLLADAVQLELSLDANPCLIMGDAGQLTQALMNLALNARDAMPDGGRLTISTQRVTLAPEDIGPEPGSRPGSFACLAVTDSGTGMEKEVLEHLFEPFFTTKPVGEGTGLGLSVIYGAVEQHEGWIHVDSEPGRGSCFRIYLPLMHDRARDDGAGEEVYAQRILLVEDDDELRGLVFKMLASTGYEPVGVASAEEALACLEETGEGFDLLFSDIVLPGKTGIELANRIREIRPDMKILLYTGVPPAVMADCCRNPLKTKGFVTATSLFLCQNVPM